MDTKGTWGMTFLASDPATMALHGGRNRTTVGIFHRKEHSTWLPADLRAKERRRLEIPALS